MQLHRKHWELFLLSAIALFLELAIIRWLSSEVRIFAYFKNLPLMAAYLGFGLGFFLHKNADRCLRAFPILVSILAGVIALAYTLGITHVIFVDPRQYFLLGVGFGDHATQSTPPLIETIRALAVMVGLFLLVVITFTALTAKIGALLEREVPLLGYSINIIGSLLGVIAFSIAAYLQLPPPFWLLLVFLPMLFFFRAQRKPLLWALAPFTVTFVLAVTMHFVYPAYWSPYYRIALFKNEQPPATHIAVNYDGFQIIQNLSTQFVATLPKEIQGQWNRHYNIPYNVSGRKIESVLIIGGGTGNDAAAALRSGATRVDVVEIDPVIAALGKNIHPERPYASPFVALYIDDARSYLQKTRALYDLIVFATLDSHTAFSSLSSLRLDNFVFTKEALAMARKQLKPDGGIAINFFTIKPWLSQRHVNTLAEIMGSDILAYEDAELQEATLLAGKLFDPKRSAGITSYKPISPFFTPAAVEPTSDNWPFLFLEQRGIPLYYLLPLLVIFVISLIPVGMTGLRPRNVNWHLFFMGAAFFLLETKAVTALALLFGSTWAVNAIVIGAILAMILVANVIVARSRPLPFLLWYGGLLGALLGNFFFPLDVLNGLPWGAKILASSVIIGLPILFASLIFAKSFARVSSPSLGLASNLLGGLVGGLLEYLDMWTGLRWLTIIALVLYVFSYIFLASRHVMRRLLSPSQYE